jgi:thiamine-monophosphate kinase
MKPVSERELVEALREALDAARPEVLLGIGDDAALLAPSAYPMALSVDASIEGVHFERSFAPLERLAARAFAAALSDLAAMGATPRAALVSLVLPEGDLAEVRAIAAGLADAARRHACPVVGGNLARGAALQLHTTVVGAQLDPPLTRSGARAGDDLWISGTVGGAHVGLTALLSGRDDAALAPFIERWRDPPARLDLRHVLRERASAAMDLSDGLLADAPRLAASSGVRLVLDVDRLPRRAGLDEAARLLDLDALECAVTGGEDYELFFAAPRTHRAALEGVATRVGEVVSGRGVGLHRDGVDLGARPGFDHFRSRARG